MNVLSESIAVFSPEEQEAERKVLKEFKNLTNSQIYEHIFIHRMMLRKQHVTNIHCPSDILGTDSCELILPSLHKTIQTVLSNTSDSSEFHLLDIGAASGEIIDWCFAKELEKNVQMNRQNIIHIIEPNSNLLQTYQQKLCEYAHLSQGIVYNGTVQDYFDMDDNANDGTNKLRVEAPLPLIPLDLINCIHMINYLVDITTPKIDPSNDIISFCKFIYSHLKPGGAIYIAHLDVLNLFNFNDDDEDNDYNAETYQKIQQITSARNSLLYEGNIIDHLHSSELNVCEVDYDSDDTMENSRKRKIKTIPKFNSYKLPSSLFSKSLADMSVLLLIDQLPKVKNDDRKFDIRLLENILEQVKEVAMTPVGEGKKKKFGLERGTRGGEIVWKIDIPLIISIIRKEKVHI
ncbi:hypothetical protein RhiirA5_351008 [Rhizophagus irregularis]|uniref:Uncharacterized protein n=3 Tax=Rhizophagus irregularis TaxID=588596 RepID=U9U2B3_RHIID|nr:hypothetical protein GLOIN_2v1718960 [Rhizophagus irregularis DAOM 181602=DAOM 197198]EXX67447.1 hypothetical protein RirG_114280 [Rhizophagus irregularis DAOM 197198w]PKC13924.1 hypothetical protein RhiirA5_351008 [Rhizophagus irregularis]POG59829.1 hypothetical protein GLOIN_2v1718960 [Rhizophagus irregularis DAOM 181602=DAOM 197198]UZO08017.1 hypothetical protein OCT59_028285 [Rhizophagus irregularis]CAB4473177.1 unnamed protein product [Rhizophagus irregularis]|eukprot:XP_025166695.1 hypothetical protein GLOIN_2v1718960 [Rhizophagus irregularis DAOM 181602=DAOM 197198]